MEHLGQMEKISWYLIDEKMTWKTGINYITYKIYHMSDILVTISSLPISITMIALHYIDTKKE